ncbi:hypothetical protein [Flavobacterium sp. HNIBRBA15423]|uniref:hypothetical protein n=1 Tax=Flavobacterium sp. HNIBRBA15423 TaxID=3458683 RepID=UPI0040439DF2
MSLNTRRTIAYWFMLILGIGLLMLQFSKYYTNTLELKIEELIVSLVAIVMTVNPLFIIDSLRKFFNSKYGKNDES